MPREACRLWHLAGFRLLLGTTLSHLNPAPLTADLWGRGSSRKKRSLAWAAKWKQTFGISNAAHTSPSLPQEWKGLKQE